jgi:hypothetical protein
VFDGDAAQKRGQQVGDGTPVHLTIPTDNPWVPLRILALGKQPKDKVEADVFLLTDGTPTLLPSPVFREGFSRTYNAPASKSLLNDLRSDTGMGWIPQNAWLTKVSINSTASLLNYDLAVDASGKGNPSPVAAGLTAPSTAKQKSSDDGGLNYGIIAAIAVVTGFAIVTGTVGRKHDTEEM